ncbi:MAG: ThuA domain-containing protein [Armatimonadetes bacterium]|nr:ThuA domain-containing protein [Armatimonadota bacterium]
MLLAAALALVSQPAILVFTKTAGFRHDSIPLAKRAVYKICEERHWTPAFTEDASWFTPGRLAGYSVVVFLMTTGDVLDDEQQSAMEGFIRSGHGYVGVHAAADTEYDWPWYGKLVGAYFKTHPAIQQATVHIEDTKHATTNFLPNPWVRTDEWYEFRTNPRPNVHVLATIDESTYKGGGMGADHPVMWCHEFDGGRAWYTALGHTKESYSDPLYVRMLASGIQWAMGQPSMQRIR